MLLIIWAFQDQTGYSSETPVTTFHFSLKMFSFELHDILCCFTLQETVVTSPDNASSSLQIRLVYTGFTQPRQQDMRTPEYFLNDIFSFSVNIVLWLFISYNIKYIYRIQSSVQYNTF